MNILLNDFIVGFLLNFILICFFYKTPIMTRNGWISAGALGTILWGCIGFLGWISVVIYLILGSLVTKVGFQYKQNIGIAEKRGGRRGPENVWGSAATGVIFAIMIKLNILNQSILEVAFAASFAAKLADTFGSEIGKRFGRNTFLITTLQKVKKGTEGGISLEGTFASLFGSCLMSYFMLLLGIISTKDHFFIVLISGFIATLAESIIGARYQEKYHLSNEFVNFIQTTLSSIISIVLFLSILL
tara:strand:- start:479 stop:1213 length:735 start_codon:yes stop_codon:yes gene_type:complete